MVVAEYVGVFQFVLLHYLFISSLIGISYIIGRSLTATIAFASFLEDIAIATTLGLGCLAYMVFAIGVLRFLYPGVILTTIGMVVFICMWWRRRFWIQHITIFVKRARGISRNRWILYGILGAFMLIAMKPMLWLPLYPVVNWDALSFHVAIAKIFMREHAVVYAPYLRFPVLPLVNQMLFTLGEVLYDSLIAALLQMVMLGLIVLALMGWAKRFYREEVGWLAAAIWLASPIVIHLGTIAYVDIGLTLFGVLGVFAVQCGITERQTRYFILGGALLILFFVLCWFMTAQILRYLVPIFPFVALIGAVMIFRLCEKAWLAPAAICRRIIAGIWIFAFVMTGYAAARTEQRIKGALPWKFSQVYRYYHLRFLMYDAIMYLNRTCGTKYRVFTLGSPTMAFFAKGTVMSDSFGPARLQPIIDVMSDEARLYHALRAHDVKYFCHHAKSDLPGMMAKFDLMKRYKRHFKVVYANRRCVLYQLGEYGP